MKQKGVFLLVFLSLLFSQVYITSEDSDSVKTKEILRYGLESEITELISKLQKENETAYNTELTDLFNKTKSSALRESIINLYATQKNEELKQFSLDLLAEPYEAKSNIVLAVLSYIGELKIKEASPLIRKILDNENKDYRDKAIQILGKLGNPEDAEYLFAYLDGEIPGDEKQRLVIRQNIMAALGELKAVESWEKLVAIANDTDENTMIRASAAVAICKMDKPESVAVMIQVYGDADPILRTAAIQGLSNYNTPEAKAIILEGFKDSYYKVRLESISAAEKLKINEAVPYILYRAKSDPEEVVKVRSFEALGVLNNSESNAWLSSLVKDDKTVDKIRVKAIAVLLENNFDYIYSDVEKIIIQTLKDDKKKWLRYELGKLIASTKNTQSSSIASAYLAHKDILTRSIGLDMYDKNRYLEVRKTVELIAADENQGALQRRAKKILDK